jgi:hypothetical protein
MALTLNQPLRAKLSARLARVLDWAYSPVISRLTDDEYFACRTRGDCVRTLARRFA